MRSLALGTRGSGLRRAHGRWRPVRSLRSRGKMPDLEARPCTVSPPPDLRLDDPDSVGYLERSLASSPLWQMGGSKVLRRELVRRDPRLLDFLASAKKAPLGELEFDVLTWTITRWYQTGRPTDGRVRATFGDIAHALYGRRKGGKQYVDVREALDHLYNVSLDLTILSIEHDTGAMADPPPPPHHPGAQHPRGTGLRNRARREYDRAAAEFLAGRSARRLHGLRDRLAGAAQAERDRQAAGDLPGRPRCGLRADHASHGALHRRTNRRVLRRAGSHRRARTPAPAVGCTRRGQDRRAGPALYPSGGRARRRQRLSCSPRIRAIIACGGWPGVCACVSGGAGESPPWTRMPANQDGSAPRRGRRIRIVAHRQGSDLEPKALEDARIAGAERVRRREAPVAVTCSCTP